MDDFINTQLHPAEKCIICTEPFSAQHQPVPLPCKHIFGHECIKRWLKSGRGNTTSCPTCRHAIMPQTNPQPPFSVPSLWKALCEQPPERLHALMTKIWTGLQTLWHQHPSGIFTPTSMLDQALIPALINTAHRTQAPPGTTPDPLLESYNLIAASWDSLGRPDIASGLAIPLVRLARLMTSAGAVLPKWLTTNPRVNRLIWRANAGLPLDEEYVSWEHVVRASHLADAQSFPLLHLYTVLVSQGIAHCSVPGPWPVKRHEVMNAVVERCCVRIGGSWKGKPGSAFKDALVGVYEELRRYQLEKGKMSLRGHDGEESVVRGIWALAEWSATRGSMG